MGRSLRTLPAANRRTGKSLPADQLSPKIAAAIRERILSWHYPPGKHLGERDLCAEFSASRIPVREALNALVEQNLLQRIPNQGCYVRQPDIREVHELYDLRLALELFVAERLARTELSAEWAVRERAYWEPLLEIRAHAPVESAELLRADEHFHLGLAQALGNAHIAKTLSHVYERLRFVRMRVITTPHRVQTTAGEHLEILEAILRHDGEAARRAMWRNVNEARNKVENALAQALAGATWPR